MGSICRIGWFAAAWALVACSQISDLAEDLTGSRLAGGAAKAVESFETDVLIPVVIESVNQPVSISIELDEPRHVAIRSYFPSAPVSVVLLDAEGRAVPIRGRPVLAPGQYTVEVTARRQLPEEFHIKVLTSPERQASRREVDPEEDNAVAEKALPVPFGTGLQIRLDVDRPEHWFRLSVPEAGIVLVRLKSLGGATQANLQLQTQEGSGVSATQGNSESGRAIYARTDPGEYLLQVHDPAPRPVGAAGTEAHLSLEFRPPDYRATGGVGIMTIGMEVEQARSGSLGFIAEATGLPLVPTFTADDILWVLATAIGDELGTNPAWALPAFICVAALLYLLAEGLRRRRVQYTDQPISIEEDST